MIKINLAPPRVKPGFSFQVPAFNLGILFGILFAVLVVLIGGAWWYVESETTRLQNEIVENQKEIGSSSSSPRASSSSGTRRNWRSVSTRSRRSRGCSRGRST